MDRITLVLWCRRILLVLAALKTINRTVYEAAAIDGAGRWEVFWKITLPALTPFIVLNTVYTIVDLSTYPFNPILESIRRSMFDVRTGMGYAAAQGWTYFSIILLVSAVYAFACATLEAGMMRGDSEPCIATAVARQWEFLSGTPS